MRGKLFILFYFIFTSNLANLFCRAVNIARKNVQKGGNDNQLAVCMHVPSLFQVYYHTTIFFFKMIFVKF